VKLEKLVTVGEEGIIREKLTQESSARLSHPSSAPPLFVPTYIV
jgi:hypothetical protein